MAELGELARHWQRLNSHTRPIRSEITRVQGNDRPARYATSLLTLAAASCSGMCGDCAGTAVTLCCYNYAQVPKKVDCLPFEKVLATQIMLTEVAPCDRRSKQQPGVTSLSRSAGDSKRVRL